MHSRAELLDLVTLACTYSLLLLELILDYLLHHLTIRLRVEVGVRVRLRRLQQIVSIGLE